MPAVVIATEQFDRLAKVIMRSQNVPESITVMIPGNPEFVSEERLVILAENVLGEVIDRLTRAHAG
jgi:hypothetical protein